MNCGVFDPLEVQNMSSGLYFSAVISAVFACTKEFDTFTKIFFLCVSFSSAIGKKTFWQIRVTCRKPLITNVWADTSICTLKIHDLLENTYHKGVYSKTISPPLPSRNIVYLIV